MSEKIPEPYNDRFPEDGSSPPSRARLVEEFDRLNEEIADWCGGSPKRQFFRVKILHSSIAKCVDDDSLTELNKRLRWIIDNETVRRDFEESMDADE